MINFDRIETDVFIGSAPLSSVDVGRLKKMQVSAVLSLQSDEDFITHQIDWNSLQSAYTRNGILVQRFPILDFNEADLSKNLVLPVRALNHLLSAGNRVYLHCNAGICRAPATMLAYLCHYRGMSIQQGLEHIRRQRPQVSPYRSAVVSALEILKAQDSTVNTESLLK